MKKNNWYIVAVIVATLIIDYFLIRAIIFL
jgi:hypothetical protein